MRFRISSSISSSVDQKSRPVMLAGFIRWLANQRAIDSMGTGLLPVKAIGA
jgi:hypothetical protein